MGNPTSPGGGGCVGTHGCVGSASGCRDPDCRGKLSEEDGIIEERVTEISENNDELELKRLLAGREYAAAFFLSRRLMTRGEAWAETYLDLANNGLNSDDDVHIP